MSNILNTNTTDTNNTNTNTNANTNKEVFGASSNLKITMSDGYSNRSRQVSINYLRHFLSTAAIKDLKELVITDWKQRSNMYLCIQYNRSNGEYLVFLKGDCYSEVCKTLSNCIDVVEDFCTTQMLKKD